jgi:glutamate synthase domain-containing protein 1
MLDYNYSKDISGCGLAGIINTNGKMINGEVIAEAMTVQRERGNGLGAGFAGYGIYPEFKDCYALHIMYDDEDCHLETERYLKDHLLFEHQERIPTRRNRRILSHPIFRRYFVKPRPTSEDIELFAQKKLESDDFIVRLVMHVNLNMEGAYVFSSGKNMGAFKGVGFPEDIADFFRIDAYEGYIWTAHNRFPTNTPGWWGGAHPFTLLDWSIVHNGEISSYGINKRYLDMFGYHCTCHTDTEVVAYLLDLLCRKQRLPIEVATAVLSAPFWEDIDRLEDPELREFYTSLRIIYGSALLNGPFSILIANNTTLVGLNDRIKLRPLLVGKKDDYVYMASEECSIRQVCPDLDSIWAPKAGEPVIVRLDKAEESLRLAG